MTWRAWLLPIVTGPLLAACMRVPTGPNVMALPGSGKSFDQFTTDDAVCRQWSARQAGVTPNRAANDSAAGGAIVGTLLGAATGAALGAASGNPAAGAAIGAGAGLLGGSLVGAGNAEAARATIQRRYDVAYSQCMYAKGEQVPLPRGSRPTRAYAFPADEVRPPARARIDVPPPPTGLPPPPPGSLL